MGAIVNERNALTVPARGFGIEGPEELCKLSINFGRADQAFGSMVPPSCFARESKANEFRSRSLRLQLNKGLFRPEPAYDGSGGTTDRYRK